MELKHLTRAEWVAALRSGKYKQARGSLKGTNIHGEDRFCCLGVACDLAGIDWDRVNSAQRMTSQFDFWYDGDDGEADPQPMRYLYADLGLIEDETERLAYLNDDGVPFEAIADEIEALPLR